MASFYSVPGAAATVQVGTVTKLAPGSDPTITNSGTPNAAVLDFGIPQPITDIIALTQAEYDALATPDPGTFYIITT